MAADFNPTMAALNRLIKLVRNLLELNLPGPLEQLLDILVKVALIPFETEDISRIWWAISF